MPITLTVPLDLPDVRVLSHRMLEGGTVLIDGKHLADRSMSPLWSGHRPVSRIRSTDPVAALARVWA